MVRSALLGIAVKLTYVSLPFVMALIYAMRIPKNTERPAWDMISIFLLAGLAGSLLYNILPATGPLYAFHGYFPWQSLPYESLKRLRLEPISLPRDIPRNAIPSLHVCSGNCFTRKSKRKACQPRSDIILRSGLDFGLDAASPV